MERPLFLRAHGDLRQRGTGRVLLCSGERNRFQISGETLAVDPQSVSARMAGPRSDPHVGGTGAGIWRAVREAMLCAGMWTRNGILSALRRCGELRRCFAA